MAPYPRYPKQTPISKALAISTRIRLRFHSHPDCLWALRGRSCGWWVIAPITSTGWTLAARSSTPWPTRARIWRGSSSTGRTRLCGSSRNASGKSSTWTSTGTCCNGVKLELEGKRNSGLEGIALDGEGNLFLLNEKKPGLLIALADDLSIRSRYELDFARDYSGLTYDHNHDAFWIIESRRPVPAPME